MLAIDVTYPGEKVLDFDLALETFMEATRLSLSPRDSIALVYSGFTPVVPDSDFAPATPELIDQMEHTVASAGPPMLNTLPHLLRTAVRLFNRQHRGGEIWLLTDARTHASPRATAMDIIAQTHGAAEHPVTFNIISDDAGHGYWYWGYAGNDYLYESLARVSWGNFVRLRTVPKYDALDLMLDCVTPTATAAELDPEPDGGVTYSRFALNCGRANFPLTLPYYEIGLFDGSPPFTVHFFGMVDRGLFMHDVAVKPQHADPGWASLATYWFACYVAERLKEPQSYATIKYIEEISTQQRLLTPYTGFVIPGPDGVCAFLHLVDESTGVPEAQKEEAALPQSFALQAYPNPFNPQTSISCRVDMQAGEVVTIHIFNCRGQEVRRFEVPVEEDQTVTVCWDGQDDQRRGVASGVYLVVAAVRNQRKTIKVTLQR